MAIAFEKLFQSLTDTGILSSDTLHSVQRKLPIEKQRDAEALARELHRQKKLTRYQVQEAYEGRAPQLVLGNYIILDKIGQGGMGQVYKAQHRRMDRIVALKMLPAAVSADPAMLARFEREVKAASKLMHPNIVAAFDADQAGGVFFLIMEYVEGSDLSAVVKKDGLFSVLKAVDCIQQAARGLEFAHKKGVIHRDIKPANLLLDAEGTVKVLDMGLARMESILGEPVTAQAELTTSGMIMGTVDYMAPEQALNTKHADARSDIYSLGCSLYFLLTGKPTYYGDTLMERILAHREQPIPSLRTTRDDVPEALDAVLGRMLAKKPDQRFGSMTEVIAALEGVRGQATEILSQSVIGPAPSAVAESPEPTAAISSPAVPVVSRKPLLIWGGIGSAVVLLMAIVFVMTRSGPKPAEIAGIDQTNPGASVNPAQNGSSKTTGMSAEAVTETNQATFEPQTDSTGKVMPAKLADSKPTADSLDLQAGKTANTSAPTQTKAVAAIPTPAVPTGNPSPQPTGESDVETHTATVGVRVNLLRLFEANPGTLGENWKFQNATLVPAEGGDREASLRFPIITPNEYEVHLLVEPLNYRSTLELDLLQKGTRFGYQLNCGTSTSGLKTARGLFFDASETTTAVVSRAQQGGPMAIVCRVRPKNIVVTLNGLRVADWRGPPPLNPRKGTDTSHITVFSGWGGFRILACELVPLTAERQPIPDRTAVEAARAKVNELVGEPPTDIATERHRERAASLHHGATAVNIDAPLRYALLTEAVQAASAADDLDRLVSVIEDLSRCFQVDAASELHHALTDIATRVRPAKERRDLLIKFLDAYDTEVAAENFEVALLLISTAGSLLGKVTEPELKAEVRVREQEVDEWRKLWVAADTARAELNDNPDDAIANLAMGQYLAQARSDWSVAAKYLIKGGDLGLQTAAQRDLAATSDPAGGAADAGVAWLDVAEKARLPGKIAYFERARNWLARGTLTAKGPALIKLQNRFKKIEAEAKKQAGSAFFKRHPLHAIPFNGHYYQFLSFPLKWDEARQHCQDEGGYLACLETPVETQWAHQFAANQFGSPKEFYLWLGAMSPPGAQNFIWVTGAPVQGPVSVPKRTGKPDGVEYMAAYRDTAGTAQFRWVSFYQHQNHRFICEWDR